MTFESKIKKLNDKFCIQFFLGGEGKTPPTPANLILRSYFGPIISSTELPYMGLNTNTNKSKYIYAQIGLQTA